MNTTVARPTPGRGCVTLQSALNELHAILAEADMAHAIPLLSEAAVRAAIPQALAQHRARSARISCRRSETEVIRLATLRPALQAIVERGAWPADACFDFAFTTIDSTGIGHDGLSVSIDLRDPEDQPAQRFALPLLEVRYGAW